MTVALLQKKPSPAVRAEAALWLAHLRGPQRDANVERGFRLWLEAKSEHAVAFEMATEVWERSSGLRRWPHERVLSWTRPRYWRDARTIAVAATLAAVAAIGTVFYLQRNEVNTGVGEQRTLTLEDGTRIFLNTDTRAVVQYDARERRVRLEQGEALFEVARQATRPFRVLAGTAQIEALGTSFVVRHEAHKVAVTLVEGKIAVASIDSHAAPPQVLSPGERLTMIARRAPVVDAPPLDNVTAWQRGQVSFDDTPLADAVAEMNRYSTLKLSIERPEAAAVPIGGIFRAGDTPSFAQAMAETYRLEVIRQADRIILTGIPEKPGRSDKPAD